MWNIWIDTGGTFTDCIAISPQNERKRLKILSSSVLRGVIKSLHKSSAICDFSWQVEQDIFKGFSFQILGNDFISNVESIDLASGEIRLSDTIPVGFEGVEFQITSNEEVPILAARILTGTSLDKELPPLNMRLGSTKGTNALLEEKGADVAFITTKGFEDLLVIRDQQRPHLFSLNIETAPPLYQMVFGAEERIDSQGIIQQSLEINSLLARIKQLPRSTSIAICLLNSYKNDTHEKQLKVLLEQNGFHSISCSTDLSKGIKLLQRADTTVVNAYLDPIITKYINGIKSSITDGKLWVMTSSGSIVDAKNFSPKDSLLSGPAGGIVGAVSAGKKAGFEKIITFDMGGTSTDVAIYNGKYEYQFETKVGEANIQSPSLHIATIAAGGGSICSVKNGLLTVGPESAGADPGPACYGAGGPLTVTDINLLSGKLIPSEFGIPVSKDHAEKALSSLAEELTKQSGRQHSKEELINAFTQITNEKMAEAIRKISLAKGHDPKEYCLISFGGAGGQHATGIAEVLGIEDIIIPYEAGLLSAYGIGVADIEAFEESLLLKPWPVPNMEAEWKILKEAACRQLVSSGFKEEEIDIKERLIYLRFKGQENTIEIDADALNVIQSFKEAYQELYGHWLSNQEIEVESIRLIASKRGFNKLSASAPNARKSEPTLGNQICLIQNRWQSIEAFQWETLNASTQIDTPAIITSQNTTLFLAPNWSFKLDANNTALLKRTSDEVANTTSDIGNLELFKNRFLSVVEDMGAILQRTSFSVNVKERMDFSCALLDANGYLIANAPHIPVHLGSMGICVRRTKAFLPIEEGDIIITNHPGYGGSHLPDVTLIAPIFFKGELIGYVANRAHHSEIGGKTPGSMPTDATSLEQEGVIIEPQYLMKAGVAQWQTIEKLLTEAPFPTRTIAENLADLRGAVASIQSGISSITSLCSIYGAHEVTNHFELLKDHVSDCLDQSITNFSGIYKAEESLDDSSKLKVEITIADNIVFDFSGSSGEHPFNLNATEAIVSSVVLYVLRLLIKQDLPLNEGLLKKVSIINPNGLLNPDFTKDRLPAVVGGNTEVSQRLTDTLIKALGLAACSQGTMNNLLFGNSSFGYYETICGGVGAGNGFDGHDAIHQHMTNTKITDPEIIEHRYPVQLNSFSVRKNSGGQGKYKGGDGIIREFKFLDDLNLTLLTQHRVVKPYGLKGGGDGSTGDQYLVKKGKSPTPLGGLENIDVSAGDKLIIKTPGGGGWGLKDD